MWLVGERGVKALTHRRVDARAELPEGSTSNHFRTRASLLQGAVEGVLLFDEPLVELAGAVENRDDLVSTVSGYILSATRGEARVATAARLALFIEARHDPCLRDQMEAGRHGHLSVVEGVLAKLGSPFPAAGALALVSLAEGMIIDMVTCSPQEQPEAAVRLVVDAVLPLRP